MTRFPLSGSSKPNTLRKQALPPCRLMPARRAQNSYVAAAHRATCSGCITGPGQELGCRATRHRYYHHRSGALFGLANAKWQLPNARLIGGPLSQNQTGACVCARRKKLAIPCGTVTEKGQQKQHKRQDKYLKFIGSISMTAFNGYYIRAMAYRFEGPHTAVSERSQSITKVKTRMTSGQRNRQRHQLQELVEASSGQALLYTKYPLNWAGLTSLSPPLSVCQLLPLVLCRVH